VWKVKVGDKVSAGDVLCDVQTDKATMEMESMEDGYIAQILVAADSGDIPCGQVRRLTQPPRVPSVSEQSGLFGAPVARVA
jgi:hypothetical protein